MDSCRYVANQLVQKLCPSVPINASDNLTDLLLCGDASVVKKACLIIGGRIIDIQETMATCANHSHFISGKKELDFSKPILYDLVREHIKAHHKKLIEHIDEAEIHIEISNNLGLESHTIPLNSTLLFHNLRSIFRNQKMRIQVCNQQRNISRERFEAHLMQFGPLSHLLQGSEELESKGKYRANSFVYIGRQWFESVVLCNEDDQTELFEEFPE
jgi:hypothetical protein